MQIIELMLMNRRGQIEVALATFVVGIIVFTGFFITTQKILTENRYVGDKTNFTYYDLKTCETKNLAKENVLSFNSKEDALKNGFQPAPCVKE